jgi:hypothetical protein
MLLLPSTSVHCRILLLCCLWFAGCRLSCPHWWVAGYVGSTAAIMHPAEQHGGEWMNEQGVVESVDDN